jgi:hypothetical protein
MKELETKKKKNRKRDRIVKTRKWTIPLLAPDVNCTQLKRAFAK